MDFCAIVSVWNFVKRIGFVVERALALFDHVIVLDTGSTDGSLEVLKEIEKRGKIELYHYTKNRGAGRDGNFLLRKADSYSPKWIVKLDHDEYLEDSFNDELSVLRRLPEKFGWVRCRRVTLWRSTGMYRIDGRYRWFFEDAIFRWREGLNYPEDAVHHMDRVPSPIRDLKRYRAMSRLVHLSQVDEDRVKLQVERLKEFDRDRSLDLCREKPRLRSFREQMRRKSYHG